MNLAADANVLLSALIGGRARLVLNHPQVGEIFTAERTFLEVEEYAMVLARKRSLPSDVLLLAVAALPVTIVSRSRYAASLKEAIRRIGSRDPDDVDLLALTLQFQIALWSNDRDFEKLRVDLFTTERLLRHLRLIE